MRQFIVSTIVIGLLCTSASAQGPDRDAIAQQLIELSASRQPEGENGWPELMTLAHRIEQLEKATALEYEDQHGTFPIAYYGAIHANPGWVDMEFDMDRRDVRFTRKLLLPRLRSEGVFEELEAVLGHRRFVADFKMKVPPDGLSELRQLAKALAGDVALAAEEGHYNTALQRIRQMHSLSEIAMDQPGPLSLLVSQAILRLSLDPVVHVTRQSRSAVDVCGVVVEMLEKMPSIDEEFVIRSFVLETQWAFAELYDENGRLRKDEIERAKDEAGEIAWILGVDQAIVGLLSECPPTWREFVETSPSIFEESIDSVLNSYRKALDRYGLQAQGTRLRLAVRMYESQHDTLPESLGALVPGILETLPVDPANDTPYGYKTLVDDPFGRSFIVYSYGHDGVDDGGREHPTEPRSALSEDGHGYDFAINYVYQHDRDNEEAADTAPMN